MPDPVPARSLLQTLRLHPRVAYQGHFNEDPTREKLLGNLPKLLPFRHDYHGGLGIVDWDHHLPSRNLTLRIYLYYDQGSFEEGEDAYDDRLEEIGARDRYPEFDVPDFADLPADES